MIEEYKKKANIGILAGLVLSIGARLAMGGLEPGSPVAFVLAGVSIIGTVTFIWGCVQYALAKGRSGWWGAFGLLSLIGLLVLVLLKDHSDDRRQARGFEVQPVRRP